MSSSSSNNSLTNAFKAISVKLFGGLVQNYLADHLVFLRKQMKKAGLSTSLIDYVSMSILTSIIVFVLVTLSITVVATLIVSNIIIGAFLGFFSGFISGVGILFLFYTYPDIYIGERKKKIESDMPFVMLYLAAMAGGGTPPVAMFRTLAKFKEYGEVAKEAEKIVEETDVLGIDVLTAFKNAAERTPSDQLIDLLWGMRTVIKSGGDLKVYLRERAKITMSEYRRRLKQFTEQLAMMTEMYITLVIVGSVLFVIITAIMGAMGGSGFGPIIVGSQLGLVFLLLPVACIGFIVFAKSISPKAD
ncbi:MAG: type II secretion system F family protein [DPANN group archaeon]|nr:type II secretion system F family protein [DPANN group archaeon]